MNLHEYHMMHNINKFHIKLNISTTVTANSINIQATRRQVSACTQGQ